MTEEAKKQTGRKRKVVRKALLITNFSFIFLLLTSYLTAYISPQHLWWTELFALAYGTSAHYPLPTAKSSFRIADHTSAIQSAVSIESFSRGIPAIDDCTPANQDLGRLRSPKLVRNPLDH